MSELRQTNLIYFTLKLSAGNGLDRSEMLSNIRINLFYSEAAAFR